MDIELDSSVISAFSDTLMLRLSNFSGWSLSACFAFLLTLGLINPAFVLGQEKSDSTSPEISYANDVRPIFAANCFGCHQGGLKRGDYVMNVFEQMIKGGETEETAIVPGKPDESYLVEMITAHDGKAEMPVGTDPLSDDEIETIRTWIEQGANNDYSNHRVIYTSERPPTYTQQPIITALDYSKDGKSLAVSGFNEVLILDVSSHQESSDKELPSRIVKRLCGLSSRIESVRFSPDGKRLAVAGGHPGETGEIQVWDVASGKLTLSKIVAFDTAFGVSWSPDGSKIAFGSTDTNLRAIDSISGKQVLFQGAHEDWIRDTVFSVDGSQLVSVARDMSCKLTDVGTQRFIDNVTSITPGVLKGGIASIARHPTRDEIVIGGADGIPKVYRMNRLTKRVIGDDANMIRKFPAMPGRIQSVVVSNDGKRIVCGSSLNGQGTVSVFSYEFDTALPANIKAINEKVVTSRSAAEKKTLEEYFSKGATQIASAEIKSSGIYALAIHPTGNVFACGGSDGTVRFFQTATGNDAGWMKPVQTVADADSKLKIVDWRFPADTGQTLTSAALIDQANIAKLVVHPEKIAFSNPTDYVQLVVRAVMKDGSFVDVTRFSNITPANSDQQKYTIEGTLIQAGDDCESAIKIRYGNHQVDVPITAKIDKHWAPDFVRDVDPVLSKLGCNAGTCHGSQTGKNGFKLSLRGYDPIYDIRSFTDDMGSRRTNVASPEDSLMLMKPSGAVPHEGGKLIDREHKYYKIIRQWIATGAKLDLHTPKVTKIELFPNNPVLGNVGDGQLMRAVATFADGSTRDVTREAVIEVGNTEIGTIDDSTVSAVRRGESAILARYEGAFTASTLTVMGKRDNYVWSPPETFGAIDQLVAAKWKRMKILPSEICTDTEFIRRVHLDLVGLPPTASQVRAFVADQRPSREKRDELVDQLIGSDAFVDYWTNKWADMLQVNRKYLGAEGAKAFRQWIHGQVKSNRPYNEFVKDILTAKGSNLENPPASYFKIHRTPEATMENTTHLFLGTRFNCNKCHDHPFERWTQDQYYETAAYFAQIKLEKDPKSGDKRIGGSAVEGAKPLYEIVSDLDQGEVKHDRTGLVTAPAFPFESDYQTGENPTRREKLASWITSPDNQYFATSYVNRLWGYLMGTGLIEPLDDIRAGNPATNPQLLEYLRKEFVENGFDMRHTLRSICKSRTYQLSIKTNPFNEDDNVNYSHAIARRLPAEVLFDSIHRVTGSELKIPGVPSGTRAAALPDSGVKLPSGFLSTLGKPARESACECERSVDLQLGSVLALVSGPDVARALNDPNNGLVALVDTFKDDQKLVDEIFMQVLNRPATSAEVGLAVESLQSIRGDHEQLVKMRDAQQELVEARLPGLEKERTAAIAAANAELDAIIKQKDPTLLKKEADHAAKLAAANKNLNDYQKNNKNNFAAWKQKQLTTVQWHPLTVNKFTSEAKKGFSIRDDRAVLVEKKAGPDVYIIESFIDLTGISAVRLEMLTDASLPANGPGLADNANLVLNEFELEVANPNEPDQWRKVKFRSGSAYMEQAGFPIADAINGKKLPRKGWAMVDSKGKVNWATLQLEMPIGFAGGTLLRFKMHQKFDDRHQAGCFRISVAKSATPTGLSLSEELTAQLLKPEQQWSKEVAAQLKKSFDLSDQKLAQLKSAVANAKKPLPVDAAIVASREKLQRVSLPIAEDSILLQLKLDVTHSEKQLENLRLTAAQDLVWALINSPSFLFNR